MADLHNRNNLFLIVNSEDKQVSLHHTLLFDSGIGQSALQLTDIVDLLCMYDIQISLWVGLL
jgi:hypothetical protein